MKTDVVNPPTRAGELTAALLWQEDAIRALAAELPAEYRDRLLMVKASAAAIVEAWRRYLDETHPLT